MFIKYFESGYSVIPLKPKSKLPLIDNWSVYCDKMPSEKNINAWQELFDAGKCGIGLCLGPASNLVAIDIDTDNADTLRICQRSPVAKRGSKGETRFFKYSKNIENNSKLLKEKGIEIQTSGRQTVLPPSIHPVTMTEYKWTTGANLLDIDSNDLEEIDLSIIDLLPSVNPQKKSGDIVSIGRNNTLVGIVSAMRSRGESELDIIEEIYGYDKTHHVPRLFTDSSEGFDSNSEDDAKKNAWLFLSRVSQSLIKKGIATLPVKLNIVFDEETIKPKTFEYKAPPVLSGFISKFVSLVAASAKSKTDMIGIGGALSVLSTIACNRFRVGATWPNLYILNIAPSGFGKTAPQHLAQLCLQGSGLVGSGNYRSGASMYSYLPKLQERLDVIDEASMLFRAMKNGDTWQMEMQELLCTLFSCSNHYFAGVTVKGNGAMNDGACYNPCINILASTTPQGFSESFDRHMSVKGLLPRFIILNQYDIGSWKPYVGFKEFEKEIGELREFVAEILRVDKKVLIDTTGADIEKGEQNIGKKYDPINYPISPSANELLLAFDKHYFDLAKKDDQEQDSPFYNRFYELAVKLSLLISLSDCKSEIDVSSVQSAVDLVTMQFHNSSLMRGMLSTGRYKADQVDDVSTFVKKRGAVYVSTLNNRFKDLNEKEMNSMIKKLMLLGGFAESKSRSGARKILYVGDHLSAPQ